MFAIVFIHFVAIIFIAHYQPRQGHTRAAWHKGCVGLGAVGRSGLDFRDEIKECPCDPTLN